MEVPGSCYALLALAELSLATAESPLSREEIARRHSLVPTTLSRYLSRLSRAGLVRSVPGRGGGHYLAVAPQDVSLSAVIAALGPSAEAKAALPACTGPQACDHRAACPLATLWRAVGRQVDEVLQSVTLADVTTLVGGGALQWADAPGAGGLRLLHQGELQAEQRILAANHREAAGILAGKLAQQFCDLLTGVVGSVSLARAQAGSASEVGHTLQWAEAAALVADQLLQQMLTQTSEHPASDGPVYLPPLLTDAVRLVTHGTAVRASLWMDADLLCVHGDAALLRQATQNLLLNAVEAMPEGGAVSVSAGNVTITEGSDVAPGNYVRVAIEDSGGGIPAEIADRPFAPYQTTKPGRSGLGLATAAAVVRRLGGAITLKPADHRGTVAEILLPAAGGARPAPAEPRPGRGGRHALIVEDEPIVVSVLRGMLESLGYQADAAAGLPEVEARLAQGLWDGHAYEVVLVDVGVANEATLAAAAGRLRQLDPAVRLIATTPYLAQSYAGSSPAGFAAALRKPFTFDDLKQALRP